MKTWVVVADEARARFFRVEANPGAHGGSQYAPSGEAMRGALVEVRDLSHPASRLHPGEMASDEPGVSTVPYMRGKFGMDEKVQPKEEEAVRFAKEVAETLRHEVGEFDRLYLIAAPHFLGLLRPDLDEGVRAKLAGEIDKDLSLHSVQDIRAHLPPQL